MAKDRWVTPRQIALCARQQTTIFSRETVRSGVRSLQASTAFACDDRLHKHKLV